MPLTRMIRPAHAAVLTLGMVVGPALVQGGQAGSAGFQVRVELSIGDQRTPAACGVVASNSVLVQCTAPGGTARPVSVVGTTGPTILPPHLPDGWIAWAGQPTEPAAAWVGLPGELSSRLVNVGGLEILEMTLSW